MDWKIIAKVFGNYLLFFTCILLIPILVEFLYVNFSTEPHPQPLAWEAFAWTACLTLVMGLFLRVLGREHDGSSMFRREGLFLVAMIWMVSGLFGALPFVFSKTLEDPVDAFFEAVSGITTTGASVFCPKLYDKQGKELPYEFVYTERPYLKYSYYGTIKPVISKEGEILHTGIEAVSKSILFWRSFMQWLGGMGIVVLFIAVLPALGVGGKFLFQAEVPGPVKDGITPRIRHTAGILWKIYLVLSLLQVGLLMMTNSEIDLYEAFTIMFSTISTGGFCIKNASIGGFSNVATEWVVLAFMLVGSVNFTIYYFLFRGRLRSVMQKEFVVYMLCVLLGSLLCFAYLHKLDVDLLNGGHEIIKGLNAFRVAAFQYISMLTSTGFSTTNYDLWPYTPQLVCVIAMYVGSMAGSTGGGVKMARHLITFQIVRDKIYGIFSPEAVHGVKGLDRNSYGQVSHSVLIFVLLIVTISILGTLLLVIDGVDPDTAFSVNSCMINNVGASFGVAGPTGNFAFLSPLAKLFCTVLMVLGRLELFALLVLIAPGFWKFR